jgi:pimeloyl-ACP methyl ester carboxylesterase
MHQSAAAGATGADLSVLPGPDDRPLPAWPGAAIDVGAQRLFVRSAGTAGSPVAVFVHGLGGSATNWTDLMALLADRFDCRAIDLPGFGNSAPPVSGSYALDVHVRAVIDYIESACHGAVHLFGNSLGGAVTARVAAARPDLVSSLTLVSAALPSYRPKVGSDTRMPLLLVPGLSRLALRGLSRHSAERRTRAIIELCFADPDLVSGIRFDEAVEEMRKRRSVAWYDDALTLSLRGLVRAYLQPGSDGLWRQTARLRLPVLIVHGSKDRLVPVAVSRRAARAIPGARLVVLEEAGHVAQIEQPYGVARAFLSMVDDMDGTVARPDSADDGTRRAMDSAAAMREGRG